MKEKVYLDATIPSFYYDDRFSVKLLTEETKRWWDIESVNYDVWISEAVIQEVSQGDYPQKEDALLFVEQLQTLNPVADVEEIAAYYIENYVMPKSLIGDAVHLAYASFYNMEYLLTWNCNHYNEWEAWSFHARDSNAASNVYGGHLMILNEALKQKYRVQKRLSESATDMHDYFEKSHSTALEALEKIGAKPNYKALPTINGQRRRVEGRT